ncbi:unnamed protein product [Callosobruchus maculatus]|uniref:Uncharacterized protein n=1 Tax=Callosobruchus maculatus TaxID=64391 RepID=A0A653BXN9_CALMS|nr:unnamed protein product [Callosobruchus maculatus]
MNHRTYVGTVGIGFSKSSENIATRNKADLCVPCVPIPTYVRC